MKAITITDNHELVWSDVPNPIVKPGETLLMNAGASGLASAKDF